MEQKKQKDLEESISEVKEDKVNASMEKNLIRVRGEIGVEPEFSHESFGKKFYKTEVLCERHSGTIDMLPVVVPSESVEAGIVEKGKYVEIRGSIRTRSVLCEDGKNHLSVYVFVHTVNGVDKDELRRLSKENSMKADCNIDEYEDINYVRLIGNVRKETKLRRTPQRRLIADNVLSVKREHISYNRFDTIPIIMWGNNAEALEKCEAGTKISIVGRLQSREYKKTVDGETITKTVYEVSVSDFAVLSKNKKDEEGEKVNKKES